MVQEIMHIPRVGVQWLEFINIQQGYRILISLSTIIKLVTYFDRSLIVSRNFSPWYLMRSSGGPTRNPTTWSKSFGRMTYVSLAFIDQITLTEASSSSIFDRIVRQIFKIVSFCVPTITISATCIIEDRKSITFPRGICTLSSLSPHMSAGSFFYDSWFVIRNLIISSPSDRSFLNSQMLSSMSFNTSL